MAGLNFGWYFIEGTRVNHQEARRRMRSRRCRPTVTTRIGPAVIDAASTTARRQRLDGAYRVFTDLSGPLFAIGADGEVVRASRPSVPGIATSLVSAGGELIVLTRTAGAFHLAPGVLVGNRPRSIIAMRRQARWAAGPRSPSRSSPAPPGR